MSDDIDPSAPCLHPPGSPAKLALLAERAAAGLPLFVAGDAQGARQLSPRIPVPSTVSVRSRRERLLANALNGKAQSARQLSASTNIPLRRVHASLGLLREAGVAVHDGKRGWRLAQLE